MKLKSKNNYSLITLFFVIVTIGYFVIFQLPSHAFSYDVLGYYMYLPLAFNQHDIALHNFDKFQAILNEHQIGQGFYQAFKLDNGNYVMKYPMGLAILYYPFYAFANLYSKFNSLPTDGFSRIYQISILYGCYIYTIIGLCFLRKIVLHFFTDKIAAVTLFLTVFATNYFVHVGIHGQGAMSHNLLFTLHALTFWFTIKWHQQFKIKYIIACAVTIGLAVLSRPTEILIILIPMFYQVYSLESLKQKIKIFVLHKNQMALFIFIFCVIVSYQLVYWKIITGHFIFDSYSSNPGEGLNLKHPYLLEFLFSFRKGWLLYTPIMIFSIIGFVQLYKKNKNIFLPIFLYFVLSLYIISSWSCWWYGTSYSSRAIIPAYLCLSIPLGYFLTFVFQSKIKFIVLPIMVFCLALNVFQSWQTKKGILDGSLISKAFYKSIFLQTTAFTDEQRKLLLIDKYSGIEPTFNNALASQFKLVLTKKVEIQVTKQSTDSILQNTTACYLTDIKNAFSPNISIPYNEISKKSYLWIKAKVDFYTTLNPDSVEAGLVVTMNHKDVSYNFKYAGIANKGYKKNEWNTLEFYFLTPDFWDKKDLVQSYFWNMGGKNTYIKNLTIEALEPITDESVF